MMAIATRTGLNAGKKLPSSSFHAPDFVESYTTTIIGSAKFSAVPPKSVILAQRTPNCGTNVPSNKCVLPIIKELKGHADAFNNFSALHTWFQSSNHIVDSEQDLESLLEVMTLLQECMLEKQLKLSYLQMGTVGASERRCKNTGITRSGFSARRRRASTKRRYFIERAKMVPSKEPKDVGSCVIPKLLKRHLRGYVRGKVSEDLLSQSEVLCLSKKVKAGLFLEDHKKELRERMGFEPSHKHLASSLRMSHTELHCTLIEYSLARDKLIRSNIRLVMSIAHRYNYLEAEMADLIQGGLIGLLRGIEKFDFFKDIKFSTYVYWWIRQGVKRALHENSRIIRLPKHLHERLRLIRNSKTRLEEKGISPSINKLAVCLNMSEKKIRNAMEADRQMVSLDREAFPSVNGLPGETLHSYVADNKLESHPWRGIEKLCLKDEVNKVLCNVLHDRERDIIRLYYGWDNECHTWEDISRKYGLSRERVRQVGLVALEKLKHAAIKERLEEMLVKH